MVQEMKTDKLFNGKICTGEDGIDPELLVLASIHILSTGCSYDTVEEATCIHECTIRAFFQNKFLVWCNKKSNEDIQLPKTEEEFKHILGY